MPTKKYLAITIGPIYQTFKNARHTREVWGASYMFSYICKGLIIKLIDSKLNINEEIIDYAQFIEPNKNKFILPNIGNSELFQFNSSVGLFPDNIIVDATILKNRTFEEIKETVIKELASEMASANLLREKSKEIEAFLTNYLRIIGVELEVENPILDITPVLNTLELQPYYQTEVDKNPLETFFKTINNTNENGFMAARGIQRFESLVEIATNEFIAHPFYNQLKYNYLFTDIESDSEGEFIEVLQQRLSNTSQFKTYHKYIAVVKADGDKIGATLKQINENKSWTSEEKEVKIQQFSENLLNWGLASKTILQTAKAKAIFIGGDDLLFFAPVSNDRGSIIQLIEQLDNAFISLPWDAFGSIRPTISYGISITYYKYPLIEALELADKLLYQAKKKGGNALAIQFLKHSGTELPFLLEKAHSMTYFKMLLDTLLTDDKSFVNSVGYKIRENEELIKHIFGSVNVRIDSLFQNVFEEEVRPDKMKPKDFYLAAVKQTLLHELVSKNDTSQATKNFYSMIRTAKFLKGLDELK
jgi:CRISPR-associated protein Cmr2